MYTQPLKVEQRTFEVISHVARQVSNPASHCLIAAWPLTDPPASTSQRQRVQSCATMPCLKMCLTILGFLYSRVWDFYVIGGRIFTSDLTVVSCLVKKKKTQKNKTQTNSARINYQFISAFFCLFVLETGLHHVAGWLDYVDNAVLPPCPPQTLDF